MRLKQIHKGVIKEGDLVQSMSCSDEYLRWAAQWEIGKKINESFRVYRPLDKSIKIKRLLYETNNFEGRIPPGSYETEPAFDVEEYEDEKRVYKFEIKEMGFILTMNAFPEDLEYLKEQLLELFPKKRKKK